MSSLSFLLSFSDIRIIQLLMCNLRTSCVPSVQLTMCVLNIFLFVDKILKFHNLYTYITNIQPLTTETEIVL